MKLQRDHKVRTVALTNLEAMCDRVSGTCHRYNVVKVTTNRVHVEYSNPDEYGYESPMTAIFPAWPIDPQYDPDNRVVALEYLRIVGDTWDGEGWQAFEPLRDCPELSRSGPDANDWRTRYEVLRDRHSAQHPECVVVGRWVDKCQQVWHVCGQDFMSYTDAEAAAVAAMSQF